jgi:hypothetical protein
VSRRLKFREGPVVTSMDALIAHGRAGGWFYWHRSPRKPWTEHMRHDRMDPAHWYRRPVHPGWILSLQVNVLQRQIDIGNLSFALPNTGDINA